MLSPPLPRPIKCIPDARASFNVMLFAPRGCSYVWCLKLMKSAWLANVITRLLRARPGVEG